MCSVGIFYIYTLKSSIGTEVNCSEEISMIIFISIQKILVENMFVLKKNACRILSIKVIRRV